MLASIVTLSWGVPTSGPSPIVLSLSNDVPGITWQNLALNPEAPAGGTSCWRHFAYVTWLPSKDINCGFQFPLSASNLYVFYQNY